jgi:hypothetical protein
MMAMFGWTDPKMPAHYIAQANREKLGMIVAFDRSQSLDDVVALPDANRARTSGENRAVTLRSNFGKKRPNFNQLGMGMVRSEGVRHSFGIKMLQKRW